MAEEMQDQRDEFNAKFQEAFQQWMTPAQYPHVRWQDVLDARLDAILHVNQLVREKVIAPEDVAVQQERPQNVDGASIPS